VFSFYPLSERVHSLLEVPTTTHWTRFRVIVCGESKLFRVQGRDRRPLFVFGSVDAGRFGSVGDVG
jgi:hypothetical protein